MQQPGPRSKAREFAFKFIYQFQLPELRDSVNENTSEVLKKKLAAFQESYREEDSEHPDNNLAGDGLIFAEELIEKTLANWSDLEGSISSKAKGWKIENMDKVDLAILIICNSEMNFYKETPTAVIINEGINLAKKFGSKSSPSFVNGVLDALGKA